MEPLKTIADWNLLFERSAEQPFILFKHSSACPVSTRAYDAVRDAAQKGIFTCRVHYVTVQSARDISDRIAQDLGLRHETPQVVVVRAGQAVYTASHSRIDPEEIAAVCA